MSTDSCPFCLGRFEPLLETARWRLVRHADPAPTAGWMMLATRAHRVGPWALDDEESADLGPLVRAVSRAIREVTGAERVYLLGFNEAVPHMHLHLVPRHAATPETAGWALADHYRSVAASGAGCGPEEADRVARLVAGRVADGLSADGLASGI